VLIGFSGAGKSSVGEALERSYGWRWIDVDSLVEEEAGKTIAEIIRVEGEQHFRAQESEKLSEALAVGADVISLGGGALLDEESRRKVESQAMVVSLAVSAEKVLERVSADEGKAHSSGGREVVRPLLARSGKGENTFDRILDLMEQRRALYQRADVVLWTDWASAEQVAAQVVEVAASLRGMIGATRDGKKNPMVIIPVNIGVPRPGGKGAGSVLIGTGVRRQLGEQVIQAYPDCEKVALVVDRAVFSRWGAELVELLEEGKLEVTVVELAPGETTKQLTEVEKVTDQMLRCEFTRRDVVIGVGGGVVGDVAGLIASLFMRGVGLVHVPTTVVAQVDSAIGGKTGVNLEGGKNILGTFYPAHRIVSDLDFLSTLPDRDFNAGFAEVVKYGAIASEDFFSWLESHVEQVVNRDVGALREVVEFCSRTKLSFVVEDVGDTSGRRALLNFGHTVGHAVEKLAGYSEYLHGEAVSMGMIQALAVGEAIGRTEVGIRERMIALLQKFSLPVALPDSLVLRGTDSKVGFAETQWSVALKADKKRVSGKINFVLVETLGTATQQALAISDVIGNMTFGKEKP